MSTQWQKRRSEFNHDWLKNRYLIALGAWLNLLDGELQDDSLERSFVSQVFPQWEQGAREALEIAEVFELEMSPRCLFGQLPLARCDEETRTWLGQLVHTIWMMRYKVPELVAEIITQVKRVDAVYNQLQVALQICADRTSAAELRPLRPQFAEFRLRCLHLARAIEKLPSEIKLI